MTNPAMKKRPNPTTGSSAPVEKKAKTEEWFDQLNFDNVYMFIY
jgi:hypothetical protein